MISPSHLHGREQKSGILNIAPLWGFAGNRISYEVQEAFAACRHYQKGSRSNTRSPPARSSGSKWATFCEVDFCINFRSIWGFKMGSFWGAMGPQIW